MNISDNDIEVIFDRELNVQDLFEKSPILMSLTGTDGYFSKVSNSWEFITGFKQEELTQRPFFDFVHKDDLAKTIDAYKHSESFHEDKEPVMGFENRYKCKDGKYAKIEWYTTGQTIKGYNLAFAIFRGYE